MKISNRRRNFKGKKKREQDNSTERRSAMKPEREPLGLASRRTLVTLASKSGFRGVSLEVCQQLEQLEDKEAIMNVRR